MAAMDAVEWLAQLVQIPSVNPAHTDDAGIAGEKRLADFLAGHLKAIGFDVACEEPEHGRPNLLASYGSDQSRQTLLLEAHLDTVGVSGMRVDPFRLGRAEGRLHGRGACDCKGPMAAALAALHPPALAALNRAGWRILFAAVMGEETGNVGAERLVARGARADLAIVLEPTDLAIVHAHKGALWFEVDVHGRAAHGSNPQQGVNAILGMMHALDRIQRRCEESPVRDALLGGPSLTVGQIRGGTAVNVVPDRCTARLDRRTLPGEDTAKILADVRAELETLGQEGKLLGYDLRVLKDGPPFHTRPDGQLVRALCAACEACGIPPRLAGAGWYSDAGPLSAVCREIVVFGPGRMQQAHTADEFIEEQSLLNGCTILTVFLNRLMEQ